MHMSFLLYLLTSANPIHTRNLTLTSCCCDVFARTYRYDVPVLIVAEAEATAAQAGSKQARCQQREDGGSQKSQDGFGPQGEGTAARQRPEALSRIR